MMNSFTYIALDARGREARGVLEVESDAEAVRRLKDMGFFPTSIKRGNPERRPVPRGVAGSGFLRMDLKLPGFAPRVKPRAVSALARQMATLLEAGMPLTRGLKLLQEQDSEPALRKVLGDVTAAIESGSSFSEALSFHPKAFNRLFIQMVKAGEASGSLDVVLARLATFMEKAQRLKSRVASAMVYPSAVLFVATGVIVLLMVVLVPKFEEIFRDMMNGRPLPAFTLLIINVSRALQNHFVVVVCAAVAVVAGMRAALATPPGRAAFDRMKLRLPGIGPVVRKSIVARITRTLGTLLSSGVPVLQALNIVRETAGNSLVHRAMGDVHASVKEGETIATPLRASGVFPAVVIGMVDVGEQTGALPEMLLKIADTYDEEVDTATAAMTSLLEPVMIVFLALVVGAIVIGMFLPILELMGGADLTGNQVGE